MKNNFKQMLLVCTALFLLSGVFAQNVSLNMLVLNGGMVPLGGTGVVKATVNASTGTAGQSNAVAAGKLQIQITVPPSLVISATQNSLPAGWVVRSNNGTFINICNSTATIEVNDAVDLLVQLDGITATTGAPTMSGAISFRTNCTGPGSLAGDNPSDNSSQAGFSVSSTVPVKLTKLTVGLTDCKPVLQWETDLEINSSKFEIERTNQSSTQWTTIGTLLAQGNSATKSNYQFIDESIAGSSKKEMYRLKMIDRDGRFSYSKILPVSLNCRTSQVNIYPNPVSTGTLTVNLVGVGESAEARLMGYNGQVLLKSTLKMGVSSINVTNIANGEYILDIDFGNGIKETTKVLLQR
jgi:Secretion system C-terminal sorting domain